MTHTYAVMDVSAATFSEIEKKLRKAEYFHAIHVDGPHKTPTLDMHGIGLQVEGAGTTSGTIEIGTILSHTTKEGRVEIQINHELTQLDLDKAREVHRMLGEAIEAAVSDTLIYRFFTEKAGFNDHDASRALLEFRELRQGSTGTVYPS